MLSISEFTKSKFHFNLTLGDPKTIENK